MRQGSARAVLRAAPGVRAAPGRLGIHLFKLWFTVSKQEQKRRFDGRRGDPLKQWKLSPNDELAVKKFAQYGAARDEMFRRTDTRMRRGR